MPDDDVDKVRDDMDSAIRDVLAKAGYMATAWACEVEVMDLEDNATYIWTMKADGQTAWMTLGLLAFHKQALLKAIE